MLSFSRPGHQLLAGDDVVDGPVGDIEEGYDLLALNGRGQHVLVAQDAHIDLLGEHGLQGQRAALHIGDVGLKPVLLEQLLLLGHVEGAGKIAVADVDDLHGLRRCRTGEDGQQGGEQQVQATTSHASLPSISG